MLISYIRYAIYLEVSPDANAGNLMRVVGVRPTPLRLSKRRCHKCGAL